MHMADIDLKEQEEHIVLVLGMGLTTIMRDNPDLFPTLQIMIDEDKMEVVVVGDYRYLSFSDLFENRC